jgi:glycosyltransferase involved in cell wall biosynthesis
VSREAHAAIKDAPEGARRFRVLLVPDSIYWVTGTIAKSIAVANPWIEATIVSGPLLEEFFPDALSIAKRFDLVHFICPYASRDWIPRLKSVVPVVTSHHHVTSWDLIKHNTEGDAIVAGSAEWVKDLESRGADMSRVFRVPYGVDVDLFTPGDARQRIEMKRRLGLTGASPVIGFFAKRASNDDDRKGINVFADAVMSLHRKIPQAGVLIVGPGWQDLVARFRASNIACAWLPFVEDGNDIPPLYHALDFYWVTARVEGGPVPLLEAMSSGVCCLSTPVGLAREVINDGVNAIIMPMNDAEAFARMTADLWQDEARRGWISKSARATMQREMRADEMARQVRPVYERALEIFSSRNGGRARALPPADMSPRSQSDVPRSALDQREQRRAEMLEALAWSENLVLYQDQRGAAFRLISKAWKDNPRSLDPPRVFLRRFLPEPVTRGVVSIKRRIRGRR